MNVDRVNYHVLHNVLKPVKNGSKINITILHLYIYFKSGPVTDRPFMRHFEFYLSVRNIVLSWNLQLTITTIALLFLLLLGDFPASY